MAAFKLTVEADCRTACRHYAAGPIRERGASRDIDAGLQDVDRPEAAAVANANQVEDTDVEVLILGDLDVILYGYAELFPAEVDFLGSAGDRVASDKLAVLGDKGRAFLGQAVLEAPEEALETITAFVAELCGLSRAKGERYVFSIIQSPELGVGIYGAAAADLE